MPLYTYTGQAADSYINLLWYGSRHYDPELGRFIQPDSIIPDPNNSASYDRYSYVLNNPIKYTDPSGHFECDYDCQVEYQNADPDFENYCYYCEWDVAEQEKNEEIAETILYGGTETAASILFEPADWAFTAYHCVNGDCSALMLLGLLPGVPSSVGGRLDAIVDTSQAVNKTVGHHTIPKQILKTLPEAVYQAVKGVRGAPNIWKIPTSLHKTIHGGPGGGGVYNAVWRKALQTLKASGNVTPQAIFAIRDQLVAAFGIYKYRP